MRCPHCGYNSFAHLEHCKKCGRELKQSTARLETLQGNSAAVAGFVPVEDKDMPSAPGPRATAAPAEMNLVGAESDTMVGAAEEIRESALFAEVDFSPAPELENHKDDLGPSLRSSATSLETSHDISPTEVPPSFCPTFTDSVSEDCSETETLFAAYSPETSTPLLDAPLTQERSSIGRRFLASVFDIFVIFGMWLLFYMWSLSLLGEADVGFFAPLLQNPRARGGLYLLLVLIAFAYFILFHYINGQTPGKMLTRIKVVSCDDEPLTLTQVLLRTCGGFVSALFLGAGYIAVWWAHDARGWNDKLADTRVEFTPAVHTPPAQYE